MRARSLSLLLVGLIGGVAGPARSALLELTGSSLTFQIEGGSTSSGVSGPLVPLQTFAQGPASLPVLVSSGAGGFSLPAGLFTGTAVVPSSLLTAVPLISSIQLDLSNPAMALGPGGGPVLPGGRTVTYPALTGSEAPIRGPGGGFGGSGPLAGTALVNVLLLFDTPVPLSFVGATSGVAEQFIAMGVRLTGIGTGWTTGEVQVTGLTATTPSGGVTLVNTITYAGFDNRTAGHAGTLLLVSPFKVVVGLVGNLPGLVTMQLHFAVPEPAGEVMLVLAAGALVAGVRRRGR